MSPLCLKSVKVGLPDKASEEMSAEQRSDKKQELENM